jgi:RHS repeat-associated protein
LRKIVGLFALLVLGLILVPALSSPQSGNTLYVNNTDPTCNGHSPCFSTIQAAVNAALSGETVQVQAGTYPEKITVSGKNNTASATEADRIIIESDPSSPPGSVVVSGATHVCTNGFAFRLQQSKFITIRDLTITGTGGQAVELFGGNNQNQAIHIERNRIFGNGSSECNGGITIARGNPGTLIVNNLIYANGRNGITFIDADGGPHYIVENTIHANQWSGVNVARSHEVFLVNNAITQNGTAAGSTGGRFGVSRESSTSPQPQGIHLLNNLICGNRLGEINGPALDVTDSSNLTPQGTEGTGVSASPGCNVSANVYADPDGPDNLPNTADDDFTLANNSPGIDRGMDPRTLGLNVLFNPIFEADFSTDAIRPGDGAGNGTTEFDIGAFEFVTPNQPPVANAGADQTAFRGQLVTLNGSQSSDPEGATLSFLWTILSQPAGSTIALAGATTASPTFTPLILGEYIFRLIVNDGQLASAPDTVKVTLVNRAPTANAGGPYGGQSKVPIQFSGSGTDPDGDAISFSWNFGDGGTALGAAPTHTYTTPGIFTVTLTVTDAFGASAISQTTATITAALVLNPIGNKTVNLGETMTFTVSASSPTGGPISLFVAPLPLPNHATFNAGNGLFTFTPDTTQVGVFQITFSAVSGNQSASETITITVPSPPPGGTTAVRGRVYNLNNTPLGNVKVTLKSSGHTAFSANDGFFTISGTPSGRQELIVNGREANLGVYAILAVPVDLIEGVLNNLANPITLPDVDVEAEVQVSPTFTTVVSSPNVPGVELTILGGTAKNSDGTPFTGKLSINPVPDYGRPESRPEELRPGMAITIQPAGVRFNPPARLTFPNADGMPPGSELNLWSLSPDTGTFSIVGKGVVTSDGQSIITVEGGVVASAWHFSLAAPSQIASASSESHLCDSSRCGVGSESDLEEGTLYLAHTLPSYRSLGQSRAVSLTYSSATADPKPIVSLDATLGSTSAVPNAFSIKFEVGGVQQGGEIFTDTRSLPRGTSARLSTQFDASNLTTGRYPYSATVFSNYLNSSIGGITNGNVIVLNRRQSPLGSGWAITDLQQIHPQADGTVLLTSGGGTASFFSGGPDVFTSPQGDFSSLVKNPNGTYTWTRKDGTKINFNAQGLETSVVDRNGNTTNYAYDGGRLLTITDPAGLITTLTYGGPRLQRITDPAGRQTLFQYDAAGNLTRITNPDSSFMTYVYDANGHVTQATDERGNTTTYSYDFAGRFLQSTRPGGVTRALTPSKLQGLADTAGGQGTATNPAPVVQSQDATSSLTDGKGNSTRFALDSLGQTISQTDALGNTTSFVRDSNGLPTKITRPNGGVTTMSYDSKGNLLASTDPAGATTIFTYEPNFNQVSSIRDPKGNTTTINYDPKGNPIEIIDALGTRTQMTYDSRGLLTSVTSAVGKPEQTTTSFTYDSNGNLLTTTDPLANVTTLVYDSVGNVIRSTDAENRITQFTYDTRNRLVSVLDPNLQVTQYGYDPKGNLAQVRDAKNQITTFAYDGLDRLISAINPLGFSESFVYDANGNLTSTINRNGQTISFNYDALNRLTSKSRPPTSTEVGSQITSFTYDSVGNLTSAINPVIGVFNEYDLANRLISSSSTTEEAVAGTVTPINADTTIGENNFQFDGRTLQVNGRTLTVDGVHTFENLILVNGAVLTHSPTTATKVNKLDITVTGTLQIDATSKIDVSNRGFLGGRQPGNPFGLDGMTMGLQRGSTGFSGGSYGGLGGGPSVNPVYGNFRNPNDAGSGGATGVNEVSGNGGGSVHIVAQTIQLNGAILANGQNGPANNSGGGSGGGVRIDAAFFTGAGQIRANGGTSSFSGGAGGGGRIAIYYQNVTTFNFANMSTFGGSGGAQNGAAGTVYLQGPARENGELIVDNNNVAGPITQITPTELGQINLTNLTIRRGAARIDDRINASGAVTVSSQGTLSVANSIVAAAINLTTNSTLGHVFTTATGLFKLDLNASAVLIDSTSKFDVSGRGFLGGLKAGNPFGLDGMTVGFQRGSTGFSGASYGGSGGSSKGGVSNSVYGDFRNPNDVGSGGATVVNNPSGNGGGLVRIVANSIQLDGSILAHGENGPQNASGGGSGGGIRIDVGTLAGTGQIRANGGSSSFDGGSGGGGRIAIFYQNANAFNFGNVSAFGGLTSPQITGIQQNGAAGTIYLQGPSRESGELIVDNNNVAAPSLSTPLQNQPSGAINLTHLRLRRQAHVRIDSLLNLTGTLEVSSNAEFVSSGRVIASTVSLTSNSFLTHFPTTATATFKVDLSGNNIIIDSTSKIDVSGRGFLGGRQPGNPFGLDGMTVGFQRGSRSFAGGSYGGLGGSSSGGIPNPVYGDFRDPNDVGSGGATLVNEASGNGGGLARIAAQSMQLDGSILANAQNGPANNSGGGSGGGLRIDVGTLTGTGQIRANGGTSSFSGGAGGGGRIAVYYQNVVGFDTSKITAAGGTGGVTGQNGTVHLEQTFAMLTPTIGDAPVMKAEVQENKTVQLASLGGLLSDLESRNPKLETQHTNLYLAMLAKHEHETRTTSMSADFDPIYTYDLNGNRTFMIDPTGTTIYTYDALNRLTSITNNKGLVTSFTYDALGRRTSMTHGNGVVTNYSYDAASQLAHLTHQLGAATINSFDYTYDKVGNRKTKVDGNGSYNYTYDTLNRLLQATNPLPSNPLETYNYDPVGNRTSSNQNGASAFNQANQLLEDVNFTYQYDNNGNLTRKTPKTPGPFTSYEYDAENKLVRVVINGTTVNYKYDGLGRRIEKEVINVSTKVTRYIYDNEDILLEMDGSNNNITARYTHGPGIDEPLIVEIGGQSFFYHADGLGSITEITNSGGTVAQRYTYSSFGKIESQLDPNFIQSYTFTGREFDPETGLYFYRARFYSPDVGRFLSQDPFPGIALAPETLNKYPYVLNSPANLVDPNGRIVAQVIGGVIGGAFGAYAAAQAGGSTGDIIRSALVGAGAGVLSTIPIPGINPILSGALVSGTAGFLGNVATQMLVEGRSLECVDFQSAGISALAGALGGALGGGVASVRVPGILAPASAARGPIFTQFGQEVVGSTLAGTIAGALDVALR